MPARSRDRKEKLAINLFDLDGIHPSVKLMLLGGKLNLWEPIWVDRDRMDETAVEFICPLAMAAACIDILRSENKKLKESPIRAYIHRGVAWTRLPGHAVLTKIVNGVSLLSPEWFPKPAEVVEWVPPPRRKVEWGA